MSHEAGAQLTAQAQDAFTTSFVVLAATSTALIIVLVVTVAAAERRRRRTPRRGNVPADQRSDVEGERATPAPVPISTMAAMEPNASHTTPRPRSPIP